jgi:hypothetical protein
LTNPSDLAGEPYPPAGARSYARKVFPKSALALLAAGLLLAGMAAALLARVEGAPSWAAGWAAYFGVGAVGILLAWGARQLTGAMPATAAAVSAFLVRLVVGVLLFWLFPSAGYAENQATQAGYVFSDAYVRDQQAWQLAGSGESLAIAFANQYPGDQYGGLMAVSAWLYRYLSPDFHRPLMLLFLTAAAAAAGVFFVWKAAAAWLGPGTAGLAAWIFALYPESVLLGSSQMREAFVLAAVAMSFYSLSQMWKERSGWQAWLVAAALLLLIFQPPAALFAFVVLSGAWYLDPHRKPSWKQAALLTGITLAAVVIVISVFASLPSLEQANPSNILFIWLSNNFTFKSWQTEAGSGIFQHLVRSMGEWSRLPVVLVYGAAQPVLPAALGDKPGVPLIWRLINIFRAAGWYSLAPFLAYGLISALRGLQHQRRWQLLWLGVISWVWVFIASANAGGNLWDNPRYRIMLLAWMALLAAWAWGVARSRRDPWLMRLLAMEGVFVVMFTLWYIGRNYASFLHIGIFPTIALTVLFCGLILGWGWYQDRRARL